VNVLNPCRLQAFTFGDLESLPQLVNGLVREGIQEPFQVVFNTDIEDTFGVTDHEAEMVAARTLDAKYLP
jgi:hypothetical protein